LALTLQNGLGNRETLAETLGKSRVVQGVTTTGAMLLGPGHALLAGEGVISIESHPGILPIEEILHSSGFNVQVVEDVRALMWGKLVINSAINPLTALLRVPNGALLKCPSAIALMSALANETAVVARSLDVDLPFRNPAQAAMSVAQRTEKNLSSMYQDVHRRVSTEIDSICGAIIQAGKEHNIPTPNNESMYYLIKAVQESYKITE
jgi:2-dehydropantoate 2-reductase